MTPQLVLAQESIAVPSVIPPSPDAAALGKYGSIPVGLHTGVPQIDIPLYTIKTKSLQVPISVSYHASGVKVNEIASWVGLGWSLNAGGVITRSVVGKSDEGGFWSNNIKSHSQVGIDDEEYLLTYADHSGDGESDYYFYNFNGRSGKFVYAQNDSQNPVLIPQEPLDIKFVNGHFEIRDEVGTRYVFGSVETTTLGPDNETYNSSYYLSDIYSVDGTDHIEFHYSSAEPAYIDYSVNYSETIGAICATAGPPTAPNTHDTPTPNSTSRSYAPLRLTEIVFSNGKVVFTSLTGRQDAPGSRLGSIGIYSMGPVGGLILAKKFIFETDHFVSATGSGYSKYRLRLDGIHEKGTQPDTIKSHRFSYNETVNLPSVGSLNQDWWGLSNGQTANQSFIPSETIVLAGYPFNVGSGSRNPNATAMQAGILNRIDYPTGGYSEIDYEPHQYIGPKKYSKTIEAVSGQVGDTTNLLDSVTFFTAKQTGWAKITATCSDDIDGSPSPSTVTFRKVGGSLLVNHIYDRSIYEPAYPSVFTQDYWVLLNVGQTYELKVTSKGTTNSPLLQGAAYSKGKVFWDEYEDDLKIAGGLRVKEMRDYTSVGATPITRKYKYGELEDGIGTLLIPTDGLATSKQKLVVNLTHLGATDCQLDCATERLLITGRPVYDLSTLNGAPVIYSQVTVYEGGEDAPIGRTVHYFDVEEDEFMGTDEAYNNGRYQMNNSWRGGDEVLASVFSAKGSKVKETSSGYTIFGQTSVIGTKVGRKISMTGDCDLGAQQASDPSTYFYYFDYNIYSGIKKMTSSTERLYSVVDPSNSTEVTTNYFYDNLNNDHQQLSRKVTSDSEGNTYQTSYWYTADFDNTVWDVAELKDNHIIGIPIKEEYYKNNQLIAGKVSHLNEYGKPVEVYQLETNVPKTPVIHNRAIPIPSGLSYIKKLDINYDAATQNIIEASLTDNVNTVYLWGYDNTYPVAKIENSDSSTVVSNLGITLSALQNLDEQALRDRLDILRHALPYAMVTSYTYDPLYGKTSETDPNGFTTYFYYDNLGRLTRIEDAKKNVLKKLEYHYTTSTN